MTRLRKLNTVHGINASIHVYNTYYKIDLLRCSSDDFNKVLSSIRYADIVRIASISTMSLNEIASQL